MLSIVNQSGLCEHRVFSPAEHERREVMMSINISEIFSK
jgi:hypothetical protein